MSGPNTPTPPSTAEILEAYAGELDAVAGVVEGSMRTLRELIDRLRTQAAWSKPKETP